MSDIEATYDLSLLDQSMEAWRRSKGLRTVYRSLYVEVARSVSGSSNLELGSGIGVSRDFISGVTTTDLIKTRYVDRAMSAYAIEPPTDGGQWDTIFAIDLLHHLREPLLFFENAASMLKPGGRIVLIEPAATHFGVLFYRLFHHEPIVVGEVQPPFTFEANGPNGEFANMGMGVGLLEKNRAAIEGVFDQCGLTLQHVQYRDVLAYPLSGGYSKPQFLPTVLLRFLMGIESMLPQFILRSIGLRMVIVIKRK